MAGQSSVDLSAQIAKYKQKDPDLAAALFQLQDGYNDLLARVVQLEIPIIQDQLPQTAGLPLGYIIVTMGNKQVKCEAFALK